MLSAAEPHGDSLAGEDTRERRYQVVCTTSSARSSWVLPMWLRPLATPYMPPSFYLPLVR